MVIIKCIIEQKKTLKKNILGDIVKIRDNETVKNVVFFFLLFKNEQMIGILEQKKFLFYLLLEKLLNNLPKTT